MHAMAKESGNWTNYNISKNKYIEHIILVAINNLSLEYEPQRKIIYSSLSS